MVTAFI